MGIKHFAKLPQVGLESLVLFRLGRYLLVGMKDGRMISPSEGLPDRRQRGGGLLPDQEHRDLAWEDNVLVAALTLHLLQADVIEVGDRARDGVDGQRPVLSRGD